MNGNELEKQVKDILQENGWQVSANVYYKDPITKKPREKDIIAILPQLDNEKPLSYNVRLFIECRYLPKETEIYSENINMEKIKNTILAYSIPFADIFELERNKKFHFYNYNKVFGIKDSEDFLYKTINQNLQSFDAFRKNNLVRGIYYLIVVYDGKLVSAGKDYHNALVKIEAIDDVFSLPYKKCFIELVSINQFENLLKEIKEDIKEINSSIQFYYQKEKNRINKNKRRIKNDKLNSYGL